MGLSFGSDEIEPPGIVMAEKGKRYTSFSRSHTGKLEYESISSSWLTAAKDEVEDDDEDDDDGDECASKWAEIEIDETNGAKVGNERKRVIEVPKLGALERHMFVEKLIKDIENDHLLLLQKMRKRVDKVGVELPKVVVRCNNLRVEAECEVVRGKPLPTLWNSLECFFSDCTKLIGLKSQVAKINIIDGFNGIIKPGRMTLLLGPPECGKTTLLKVLSGNLDKSLKVAGEVFYNGFKLEDLNPQKTSAYVSQNDLHTPEVTVREALDFSARCQGIGSRAEIMVEVSRRERNALIVPDPDIDTFMKAISIEGQKTTLQTDYILKILGLDICADTLVGDAMRRGVSGGQKRRLTLGEMMIGPTKALFMDEISNGLDSSTTYQIVTCLQQLSHIADATIVATLLQPAPEIFDLFDDIILMAEGKIVYHGPRSCVLEFFEDCGFRCPERKGVSDFLQEVISRKDQAQYWHQAKESCSYISVDMLSKKFKKSTYGKKLDEELSQPFMKSSHKNAISFSMYSLSKRALLRACMSREYLLIRRNYFIYVFKSIQLIVTSFISMTIFLRRGTGADVNRANHYSSALFFSLIILFLNGFLELSITVARLAVFYKQRDLCLYPAWSYAISSTILKVPFSLLEALIWTSLTYYGIGYSPEPGRLFRHFILLFVVHFGATSMFRFLASVFRTIVASTTAGSLSILCAFLFSGFIIPKSAMPAWLKWGFWVSPLTYGEVGLAVNEFLAPRWQKTLSGNTTIGKETLATHGLNFGEDLLWLSLGVLLGFGILFNIGFTLALTFLNHRVILPFEPLTLAFQDVQYYVKAPAEMRKRSFAQEKVQLLCDITGALRPGVLTALMGVSGAGKTTLLDVLAGRKTSGTVEGDIRVGGFPKIQDTFSRISGYCEQTDIHSPQITIEESLVYSAWLRLHPEIDSETKFKFLREVLEIIELDEIKDCLVGRPGVNGLSIEQRKRLTIAVELVANPSIIFMDEPTTGLDARAAAIVMRAVKNVADTGRTIVCTIHQPSIHIFEAFDELLLLKTGGRIIYSGPLGEHSSGVIKYFEGISRVPKIMSNYNPAMWMLEVTSTTLEAKLDIDFAQVYKSSVLYKNNKALVNSLSSPPPDSKELYFATRFSQNWWGQFKSCLWKQHLSYWRSPSYNLTRFLYSLIASLLFGILFWDQGMKIDNQQNLFNVLGAIFAATFFMGVRNCAAVLPYVSMERSVVYRERSAGMYSSWAYALSRVTIEVPYLLAQAIIFVIITYPMIGYYWSAFKVLWYFYAVFCTLMCYTYFGMLLVAMTPSFPIAAILQSGFNVMFNLFSGFYIPQPQIPKWWIWMYYLIPTSWTIKGILTSQYGDIQKEITVFGETQTVSAFLRDYFGYNYGQLLMVGVVLITYPILFASLFAYCIGRLNFQKR